MEGTKRRKPSGPQKHVDVVVVDHGHHQDIDLTSPTLESAYRRTTSLGHEPDDDDDELPDRHQSLWTAVARQNQDFSSEMKPFADSFASICLAQDGGRENESAKFGLTMQDGPVAEEGEARTILEPYTVQVADGEPDQVRLISMRWSLHPLQVSLSWESERGRVG